MSLYVDVPIRLQEPDLNVIKIAWSCRGGYLALASANADRGGSIVLYNEWGDIYNSIIYPIKVTAEISQMSWHPVYNFLITAWTNSDLLFWNENDFLKFSLLHSPHKKSVIDMVFSERGSRLVTHDHSGLVVGWSVSSSGFMSVEFQKTFKDAIVQICFCPISTDKNNAAEGHRNFNDHVDRDVNVVEPLSSTDNQCFYLITKYGTIYYVNRDANCSKILVIKCRNSIDYSISNRVLNSLLIMVDGCVIENYKIEPNGKLSEISSIKLRGHKNATLSLNCNRFLLAGYDTLVILIDDLKIRICDLISNSTYFLPIRTNQKNFESITTLSYCRNKQILNAATKSGQIYFWTRVNTDGKTDWLLGNTVSLSCTSNGTCPLREIVWNPCDEYSTNILAINCSTKLCFLKEQNVNFCCLSTSIFAVQVRPSLISIETENVEYELNTGIVVLKMDMTFDYLVISDGQEIVVYKVRPSSKGSKMKIRELNRFYFENEDCFLRKNTLIIVTKNEICMKNLLDPCEQKILLPPSSIWTVNLTLNFLTITFSDHQIQIYEFQEDINNLYLFKESKFEEISNKFSEVIQAKFFRNLVAFVTTDRHVSKLVQKLNIWNIVTETYTCLELKLENFQNKKRYINSDGNFGSNDNILVVDIFWDLVSTLNTDCGYLVCFLRQNQDANCVTFLISDNTINHISITQVSRTAKVITYEPPCLLTYENRKISKTPLKEFADFQEPNLNYICSICNGHLQRAYDSIRSLKNEHVWINFAKNCVLCENLDFGLKALRSSQDLFGVQLLKSTISDKCIPVKAKVATFAAYLGMMETAEELFRKSNNDDLLAKFYCETGQFELAIKQAEKRSNKMAKSTYHLRGKCLEKLGDFREAVENYEKAGTLRNFLSRALIDQPANFDDYVFQSHDRNVTKWMGKYYESRGDFDEALNVYDRLDNQISRMRILCNIGGDQTKIDEIFNMITDSAQLPEAYLYYGQFNEKANNYKEALVYYGKAQAYYNVKRICKDHGMIFELSTTALNIIPNDKEKLDCAKIFEINGYFDVAINLYKQLGLSNKVTDLAVKCKKFEYIDDFSKVLRENTDSASIETYVNYFVELEHFDKAAEILIITKQYDQAIELCSKYNLKTGQVLLENELKSLADQKERSKLLEKLAKINKKHGNYNLASKRYIQSGNRYKAMKSLLKSGDSDQIIMFANISNQPDVYKLAATWLQSRDCDYYRDTIVEFYTKAKCFDILANFYVVLAQNEVNCAHNYNQAFKYLNSALKTLENIDDDGGCGDDDDDDGGNFVSNSRDLITTKLKTVSSFIKMQHLFKSCHFEKALKYCKFLIRNIDVDKTVHLADFVQLLRDNYNVVKHDVEVVAFLRKFKQ